MIFLTHGRFAPVLLSCVAILTGAASAQVPDSITAPGQTVVVTLHAEDAQIYECKADASGNLVWVFREPIATLFVNGKTVGRHYAGPSWELNDGSAVVGKVIGNSPGATSKDIPWLKLEVVSLRGSGTFTDLTIVQRINTRGGKLEGICDKVDAYESAPYSADYVFLRQGTGKISGQ